MSMKGNEGKVFPVQEDSLVDQKGKKQGSLKISKSKSAVDSFEFDSSSDDSFDFGDKLKDPVHKTRLKKMKTKLVETSAKLKEIVLLIENEKDERSALAKLKDFLKGHKQQAKTFAAMGHVLNLNVKSENHEQAAKLENDSPTITIAKPEETAQTQQSNRTNLTTLLRKRINLQKTTLYPNKDNIPSIEESESTPSSIKNLLAENPSPINSGRDNPDTPTNLIKKNASKNTRLY